MRWRLWIPGSACLAALLACAPAMAVPVGSTVLVDRPSGFGALPFDGVGESAIGRHALTPDGRYAVFTSSTDSLLATDDDTGSHVYRVDRSAGVVVQVDTTPAGGQPSPWTFSQRASISADGRYVAFSSTATNLHPAVTGGTAYQQVYVKDLQTGAIELASRGTGVSGAPAQRGAVGVVSGDGRHVAFVVSGSLDGDNADGVDDESDAYVRSLDVGTTHMVSVTAGGAEGGGVGSEVDINHVGDAVAFVSTALLHPSDTGVGEDLFVRTGIGFPSEMTRWVTFTAGQTGGAGSIDTRDGGFALSPSGTAAAWTSGGAGRVFYASLLPSVAPATYVDAAALGGTNAWEHLEPFFAPTAGGSGAGRVYWRTRSPLSPADTNGVADVYGADLGHLGDGAFVTLMTSGQANGDVEGAAVSQDGSVVVFDAARATNLPGTDGAVRQVFARSGGADVNISQPPGVTARTNAGGSGYLGEGRSVSDDGRVVVFSAGASVFGSSPRTDTAGLYYQLLARDMLTGTTSLLSVQADGVTPARGFFGNAAVDAAGRRVAFTSDAPNLVAGDTGPSTNVFVRDLSTGVTTLVDRTPGGAPSAGRARRVQISADGTRVAFISSAADLPGAPAGFTEHVWVAHLPSGALSLVDRSGDGTPGNDDAETPDLSGDGTRIAFWSTATNLGGGTTGGIFVRNTLDGTTTWVSVPQDGNPAHSTSSAFVSISRDGRRVAFADRNPLFGHGATGVQQLFVRDVDAGSTTLVSTGPAGPADREAYFPSLSADGTRLSFISWAANLPGSIPGRSQVYVRDLTAGTTVLGSAADGGGTPRFGADGGSGAGLSGNGACLMFASYSDDVVSGGYGPDGTHVYMRALTSDCPAAAPGPGSPTPPVVLRDTIKPRITRARMTRTRFRVGLRPTALSAATKAGTAFSFSLSENARATIAVRRSEPGRRSGARCVKLRKTLKRRCTRTVTLLTLTRRNARDGANTVTFSGRYGRRKLVPGRYSARLSATDAVGNRSNSVTLPFIVVRR